MLYSDIWLLFNMLFFLDNLVPIFFFILKLRVTRKTHVKGFDLNTDIVFIFLFHQVLFPHVRIFFQESYWKGYLVTD